MKKIIHILLVLLISFDISYAQCNGDITLCSKTYDEVSYLTTHNAFNSAQDGLLFPNQTYNITSQMNDGVRALMIDVYDLFGNPTAYHSMFMLGSIPLIDLFNNTFSLNCSIIINIKEDRVIFNFSILPKHIFYAYNLLF